MSVEGSLRSGERLDRRPIFRVGAVEICRVIMESMGRPGGDYIIGLALLDTDHNQGVVLYLDHLAVISDVLAGEVRRMEEERRRKP